MPNFFRWRYKSYLTKAGILGNLLGIYATTLIYHILTIKKSNNSVMKLLKVVICKNPLNKLIKMYHLTKVFTPK
jgi:hypothetical protein